MCDTLKLSHKEFRYLPDHALKLYCEHNCRFLRKFDCDAFLKKQKPGFSFGFDLHDIMKRMTKPVEKNWLRFDISTDMYVSVLKSMIPYLLVIVPIMLQWLFIGSDASRQAKDRGWLIFVNGCLCVAFLFNYGFKSMVTANYITYSYMSAFSVVGTRVFQDLVCMYGVLFFVITVSLTTDDLYVLGAVGITASVGLIGQIYISTGRRSYADRVTLVTTLCNLAVVGDLMQHLLYMFALDNFGISIVRLAVHGIMPIGDTESFLSNMVSEAAFVAGHAGSDEKVQVGLFFTCLIIYALLCFGTRALIGAAVLSSLKFDFSFSCIATGFYAYTVDLVNPFLMVSEHILSQRENSVRKVLYGIIMIFLMINEFFYARDLLMLRVSLFILDLRLFQTGLVGASRFLDERLEMTSIAFPKPGAFPFASLDKLLDIRRAAKRLTVSVRSNPPMSYSGVGMLWHGKQGARLITVRHVLMDKHEIMFSSGGEAIHEEVRSADIVGTSVDPTVSMKLLVQHDDSIDLNFLSISETKLVSYLFVISPEGVICPVTKWKFDNKGDIHASVNLMQGDSGTPVVAILKDGCCRFAGTVSRGDARSGHSNLFSSVVSSDQYRGSPGTVEPYLEIMNIKTQSDLDIVSALTTMLQDNRKGFLDRFPPQGDEDADKYDERDYDYERRGHGKTKVKNWKKDKAARKRSVLAVLNASPLNDEQRDEVKAAFDESRVIEFNARRLRRQPQYGIGFISESVT
jgi:hypothetical protein